MKLLTLVLLISAFSSLALTEVVKDWKEPCSKFFIQTPRQPYKRIFPIINPEHHYKKICQLWRKEYRFATVYDTKKRIPVYSAYMFLEKAKTVRIDEWKIEPELENPEKYKNKKEMIKSPPEAGDIINQAVNSDYTNSGYTRGHVFPKLFAGDQGQADSTFTLTNGQWAQQVEEPMLRVIRDNCTLDQNHLAYIVTGVVPGNNYISITRQKEKNTQGINIPSHFWSVFCCASKQNIKKLVGKAYIAEQDNFIVCQPSIEKLNELLTDLYKVGSFKVFPGLKCEDLY